MEAQDSADFAPEDSTDFRDRWDWRTKYDGAVKKIWFEAYYLLGIVILIPALLTFVWLGYPNHWLALPPEKYRVFTLYSIAWLGGMLGGTLFDLKWLYHSVAKGRWHEDRRPWRIFVPFISGGLAVAILALLASGFLEILDLRAIRSNGFALGFTFIVGYFSDNAIARLSQIALEMFGKHPTSVAPRGPDGTSRAQRGGGADTTLPANADVAAPRGVQPDAVDRNEME